MRPEDRDRAFLWDMLEAAKDIASFVEGISAEDFAADKKVRFAVERQLLVLGEAAKRVSEPFRAGHSEIPWKNLAGLRNILAHEYGEIVVERIWLMTQDKIPALIEALSKLQ
jgi:uncharacterized protein with HEPN domain